jgi:predicted HTH domain antitoxin
MANISIPVEFDARIEKILKGDEMPLQQRMRVWAAISLYLDMKVSIGKAAELAGMHYGEFQEYLGKHQIPVSLLTLDDVLKDIEMLKKKKANLNDNLIYYRNGPQPIRLLNEVLFNYNEPLLDLQ